MGLMKQKIVIYEKPTCSTCRVVMGELRNKGVEFEAVNYYERAFTRKTLSALLKQMHMKPRELLRTKEQAYKELNLGTKEYTDNEILDLMIENPDLIQRPIVVKGKKVLLVRPVERLKELLK